MRRFALALVWTSLSAVAAAQAPQNADVNRDGIVDAQDVAAVQASLLKRAGQPGFNPLADVNGDSVVNVTDASFVSRNLGTRFPPTIASEFSSAANANGWWKSDVTITYTCTGTISCPSPTTVTTEGAGQVVDRTVTNAGGSATNQTVLNIDKTPPVVSATLDPPANANDWNAGQVTVTFSATDNLSGVAAESLSPPVTLASDGANQSVTGQATDLAGNVGMVTRSGINIDQTSPSFTFTAPADGATVSTPSITVTGTASDALSGVASVRCNSLSAAVSNGEVSCAVPLSVGANSIVVAVTDVAGNSSTATRSAIFQAASASPIVTITSPADSSSTSDGFVAVTGTVSDSNATVTVNGLLAAIINGTWSLSVPLVEGLNVVAATATNPAGSNTATITVTLVLVQVSRLNLSVQPPTSPTFDSSQTMAGSIGGAVGQTAVTIVGGASAVSGNVASGLTQFGLAVPLRPNAENVISVTAADSTGHTARVSDIHVVQLSLSSLVTAQVTAQRLTTPQVEALVANGTISLDDPANFNVSTFTLALNVAGRPVPVTVPVHVIKPIGELLAFGPAVTLECGAPDSDIEETTTGYSIPCDNKATLPPLPKIKIVPFEVGFPEDSPVGGGSAISGVLLLHGQIRTLKEFFKATLLLANVSPNFTLTGLTAKITIPDSGLSPVAPAGGTITMGDLIPGAQGSGDFIIRGDLIGTHTVSVNFGGQVTGGGLSAPVPFSGSASTTVEVEGPPNLNVTVEHPAEVTAGVPYTLTVNVKDTSAIDALFASLELNLAGADLINPTTGSPFTGASVASLGNILAGETVSQSYTVLPHISGPITSCIGGATINITLSVVFSGAGGPDCAIGTLPSQVVSASGQPTVSVLPAPNTTNVPLNASISAFFSDAIQTQTLTLGPGGTFRLADNTGALVGGQLQFSPLTNGATAAVFRPSAPLKGSTTYTVFISRDIFAVSGAHLASGITASFTTAPPPPDDATPPQVTVRIQPLTNPSAIPQGQLVSVLVNASDDSGVVSRLDLQIDGELVDARGPVSSVTFIVDSSELEPGSSHVLTAIATDAAGNTASASVNISIIADTNPPTVSLAVANRIVRGQTLPVSIQANDDVRVAEVDVFLDGGADPIYSGSVAPYRFTINTTSLADGPHSLFAFVVDGGGNTAQASQAFSAVSTTGLSVLPSPVTITGIGATQALTAIGTYSDGSVAPLNSGVSFLSTDTSHATVDPAGVVTAVAPGPATIAAAIQSPTPLLSTVAVTVAAGQPTTVSLIGGDQQTAVAGQTAGARFIVRVADGSGRPVPGVAVTFEVVTGGGSLTTGTTPTDSQGRASTTLTLGATPGANTVTATAGNLIGSPIIFRARGISNQPPTLTNPGNQASTLGTAVSLQLSGSDPNGDPLIYSATGLPPSVGIDSATGLIAGTLSATAGSYPVTVTASNGTLSSHQTFTWTLTPPLTPYVDLAATQTVSPTIGAVGGSVTYTVTATNLGSAPATNVVTTDTLPGALTLVSASAGCVTSGATISCSGGTLAPSQTATHTITAVPYRAGAISNSVAVTSAEFDVASINNTATALMTVVGAPPGAPELVPTGAAEVFTPATGTWAATGGMTIPRGGATLTVLADGTVLVLGGIDTSALTPSAVATGELYNPTTRVWTATTSLTAPRAFHSATLLATGDVLITGGVDLSGNPVSTTEVYRGPPIQKVVPVLTWATPSAIAYGTALSSLQLNATANVPGTFIYTPGAGTTLVQGTHTLSVTFVANDGVQYTTATIGVTLMVTP